MIQLSGAGKRYGHKLLFENADWLITPESRIGLVGANGTGKSTIMKILAGSESLDYGTISRAKGISTGYLPQDGLTMTGRTVFAECMSVFAELHAIEKEMEALTRSMSELDHAGPEYSNVADRYQKLEHEFVARDGYTLEAQVGQVLTGLGFRRDDWTRRTEEFSGGWQMRIALAKLLLQKPNLLLLDEPTNHLDLEARNWLEEYLTTYPYAFVLISHDRYFLDITVKRIVEIWNKQMHFYAGNYDQYLAGKTARKEQLESAYKTQHDRIEQLEVFINRFRYTATKAKQVQSRIKELEKMERIEIPEEEKTVRFSFPQPKSSGRIVAEFTNVAKSYGDRGINEHKVFEKVNFMIERGERIALVGVNGAGKSTLIKLLAGQEPLTAGEYKLGHNVEPDYFAQDQYNNHLDLRAKDVLLEALMKYTGTVVFVSHDRYFIDKLATRVFEIGDGKVEIYPGNYEDYLWRKQGRIAVTVEIPKPSTTSSTSSSVPVNGDRAPAAEPADPKAKRLNPIKRQQMEDRLHEIEEEIARAEAAIALCETQLQSFVSAEETQRQTQELARRKNDLQSLMKEWEELSETLETAT